MITNSIPVITIDGPSGSGKGEVGQRLAEKLGWHFLDSGAIYRVLAFVVMKRKISPDDVSVLVDKEKNLDIKFIDQSGLPAKIFFEEEDITTAIRQQECGIMASKIAMIPQVREALIQYQRSFCKSPGLIADGRDMGTVVFFDAKFKIFLTASIEERAKRRFLQLQKKANPIGFDEVLKNLIERDKRDYNRAISSLKADDDALIIDTTILSIDEVLEKILGYLNDGLDRPCGYEKRPCN